MGEGANHSVAVHLGASSLSLIIVEERAGYEPLIIDFMEQPVPFARDIFRSGRVKRDTIERCVAVLHGYLKTVAEYGLDLTHVTAAVITSTIEEARNSRAVVNRFKVACGIKFRVLEDGDMTRLIYQKVQRRMLDTPAFNTGTNLAIHVGPGNTRVVLLRNGQIERYTSYRMGTHRVAEALRKEMSYGEEYLRLIRGHCSAQLSAIKHAYRDINIESVTLMGYELQQVASYLNDEDVKMGNYETYRNFIHEAADLTEEERVRIYDLDFHAEDAFLPALQMNYDLLHIFDEERFWVSSTHYEKGLLQDLALRVGNDDLIEEVLRSARLLAMNYGTSADHYEHVLMLATQLFEQTQNLHHLGRAELLLLKVAAVVHEIGGYVSSRMHHKHSQYLIQNSEIFGISQKQIKLIALISRYHRQSPPKDSHRDYMMLSDADQLVVSKLAALLRVADSLDTNHTQRITSFTLQQRGTRAILSVNGVSDARLERLSLDRKGDLFEEIFGLELQLIEQDT